MADQTDTYTARIVIEAQGALAELEKLRINIEQFKARIKEVSATSGEDFNKIAEGIRRATEASIEAEQKKLVDFLAGKKEITPEELAKASAPLAKLNADYKALSFAVAELKNEEKRAAEEAKKFGGDATAAATQYRQKVDELKNSIMQMAAQQRISFQDAARGMQIAGTAPTAQIGQALREVNQEAKATVAFLDAMKGINNAAVQAKTGVSGFVQSLGQLGSVGKYVFGTVLGLTAVTAIRDLIGLFSEAIKKGLEFQQTLFTMEVAIRGLQRVGLSTTIEEWRDLIESVKDQFPIFPRQQITESIALAALMTREFEFTAEQIGEVVRMSAVLAELTGKDLHESVRGITYAIGSGYFESLQRAGINISRQIVAEEALRQGYEGSYTALDQNVRALITYNIIQKNLAAVQSDAGKIMETTAGKVRALKAAWEDLLATLGLVASENNNIISLLDALGQGLKNISTDLLFYNTLLQKGIPAGLAQELTMILNILSLFDPRFAEIKKSLIEFQDILGNLPQVSPESIMAKEQLIQREKILSIVEDINAAIENEEEEAAQKRRDILIDYLNDVEQLWIDHQRRMADLQTDYEREIADIDTSHLQDIEDENRDFANSVAEASKESANRRADAERKYRDQELIAELRFQERMRQLREGFLFDLEDAVRERDARQIIRLTRQYNMEREQLIREEEINKKDRWLAYQRQLQDIDRQKQERMSRLYAEHVARLQEIDIQAERERERAKLEFERKQEDEKLRYEQEKQDRRTRYDDQLQELDRHLQERINEVAAKLLEEHDVTVAMLQSIYEAYNAYYGPGGYIEGVYKYYMQMIANMRAAIPYGGGYGATPQPPPDDGQAEGGTMIATKATKVLFGEAGPEMATFTPLSRAGVNVGKTQGSIPAGMGKGAGNGKLLIQLNLDPGLQYEIVDQAMGELADVITHIERARK